jgi:GNAT superfamily N-acetyltransferase
MSLEIREEPVGTLLDYSQISIAFLVECVYKVEFGEGSTGNPKLIERPVKVPYIKEYDLPCNCPTDWTRQYDLTSWGQLSASVDGRRVGAALIAFDTSGVDVLEGRADLAVLWDLRVSPEMRRSGVASKLFAAAERWAAARGCRELKVETQNINVPACRFYFKQGCTLRVARAGAYRDFPEEVMLLWYKELVPDA